MFNDYFNTEVATSRLLSDYEKHKNLIIAFDFDNTIYNYHNYEEASFENVKSLLKECSDLGFTMILYTCNEDIEKLNYCKEFCKSSGIRIDYINESPIMNTRKPYYNILLDDRAGLQEAYCILYNVVKTIKNLHKCKQ